MSAARARRRSRPHRASCGQHVERGGRVRLGAARRCKLSYKLSQIDELDRFPDRVRCVTGRSARSRAIARHLPSRLRGAGGGHGNGAGGLECRRRAPNLDGAASRVLSTPSWAHGSGVTNATSAPPACRVVDGRSLEVPVSRRRRGRVLSRINWRAPRTSPIGRAQPSAEISAYGS